MSEGAAGGGVAASGGTRGRLAVLYDRDCGVCAATARTLRRWDRAGRLDVMPLQTVAADPSGEVARLTAGRSLTSALHVVDQETDQVVSGGRAVLEIVRRLPGGSAAAGLVEAVPPARWAVGRAYDLVARNRHGIGRWLGLEARPCDVSR